MSGNEWKELILDHRYYDWETTTNNEKCILTVKYKKKEPKAPTHEKIITKWWRVDHGQNQITWNKPFTYIENQIECYGLLFREKEESLICGHRTFKKKSWFTGRESADVPPEEL